LRGVQARVPQQAAGSPGHGGRADAGGCGEELTRGPAVRSRRGLWRGRVPFGMSAQDLFDGLSSEARSRLVRASQPDWVPPMLATLTEKRFSDPGWMFERKLDGERCLAFRTRGRVRLLSRNRLEAFGYP